MPKERDEAAYRPSQDSLEKKEGSALFCRQVAPQGKPVATQIRTANNGLQGPDMESIQFIGIQGNYNEVHCALQGNNVATMAST